MKPFLSTLTVLLILYGCGGSSRADTERQLAAAQQKLEEAITALREARIAARSGNAADLPALKSSVEKAQTQLKSRAGVVEGLAKETRAVAATVQDKADSEAVQRAAILAESKAQEARRLAEATRVHTVDADTPIAVRTLDTLSTKTAVVGTKFDASLHQPLVVDGYVVADRGAMVEGVVTNSDSGGKVKGRASLSVSLRSLKTNDGKTIEIQTQSLTREARGTKKKDATRIGITTGVGAAIGAIIGGGKGAAIGAGAGAAGGAGWTVATKGEAAVLPSESLLTFRLAAPFRVEEVMR